MSEFGGLEGGADDGDYCDKNAEPDGEELGDLDESIEEGKE